MESKDKAEPRVEILSTHPWMQNFIKISSDEADDFVENMLLDEIEAEAALEEENKKPPINQTITDDKGNARTELDTSFVTKIEVIPSPRPRETTITFIMKKEDGEEIPFEGLNGILIAAITDQEYYMSIAGDPLPSVLFFANELRSPATFIWNLVISSFTFAIGDSDFEQLASIHDGLNELQNLVLDRYSVLRQEQARMELGLDPDEPIPPEVLENL